MNGSYIFNLGEFLLGGTVLWSQSGWDGFLGSVLRNACLCLLLSQFQGGCWPSDIISHQWCLESEDLIYSAVSFFFLNTIFNCDKMYITEFILF